MSIETFFWGFIVGAGTVVLFTGHNGLLSEPEPVAHPVSQRFIHNPGKCTVDFPQYALVCHYIDNRGNHVIHTRF